MKIFWSWQSDTPGKVGRFLVRDALNDAIEKLKQAPDIQDAVRQDLHLDQDIQGATGSPDLARTIFDKIEKSEVVVADVTIVGKTEDSDGLVNSNVAIELGYALHACTDGRVVLVFNKHYGMYEDLPFDLRHKGGAVVFDLAPGADRKEIEAQRKTLCDDLVRKLTPFLQQPPRIKESLSLRAIIEHQLLRRYPLANGGADDVFQLLVSVKNDGEQAASDFRLDLELPGQFLDGSVPYGLLSVPSEPGFRGLTITKKDIVYPETQTLPVVTLQYAVRDETKKLHPEDLEKSVTAIVYSGNMKPRKTSVTIAELATVP